ncbi:hypothetical protein [Streptomyces sp. NPDC001401]|uniref:hypothetical protein n=1 Tax=Streptomyces sp. NPDC001401 TaxID=3364570 RepID=UPI0036AB1329
MTRAVGHVRRAALARAAAGADLVIGRSAHLFRGVTRQVLFGLGDYADHPALRNDLGLLWPATYDAHAVQRTEVVPTALDHCRTRLADRAECDWAADRLTRACAELGTCVTKQHGRLTVAWPRAAARTS